jgi:ADP-ribose pyrophosphatase
MSAPDLDPLSRYRAIAAQRPELFRDAPGGFTLLLDPADIARTEAAARERLVARGLPEAWARVGVVYEDPYILVLRDAVRFPDGHLATYIRILSQGVEPAGVAVLAVHDGRALLLRHFRHATREFHLEIPRGFRPAELSAEEAARTEILEEVGSAVTRLVPLGPVHVDTGLEGRRVELYWAELDTVGTPELHEAIAAFVPLSIPELEHRIREAEITDAFTLMAFTRARLRGLL